MRFVTLNLDTEDATTLRNVVEGALGACSCQEEPRRAACQGCAGLSTIRDELSRFLTTGTHGRVPRRALSWSLPTPPSRSLGGDIVLEATPERRSWVVPSGITEA